MSSIVCFGHIYFEINLGSNLVLKDVRHDPNIPQFNLYQKFNDSGYDKFLDGDKFQLARGFVIP